MGECRWLPLGLAPDASPIPHLATPLNPTRDTIAEDRLFAPGWWRERRTLLIILGVASLLRVVFFVISAQFLAPLGDEMTYVRNADAIAYLLAHPDLLKDVVTETLSGDFTRAREFVHTLVGDGWFLPGMSLVLLPIRLVTSSAAVTRAYVFLLNTCLFWLMGVKAYRALDRRWASAFLILMAVIPFNVASSFSLCGDHIAGQALAILLFSLVPILSAKDLPARWFRFPFLLGVLLVSLVYMRPPCALLCPFVILLIWIAYIRIVGVRRSWPPIARTTGIAALTVMVGLLPWQLSVYSKYGEFFWVTTSVEPSMIRAFSPASYLDSLPPGPTNNKIVQVHLDQVAKAEARGVSYRTQVRDQWRLTRSTLSFERYQSCVRTHLHQYLLLGGESFEVIRDLSAGHRVPGHDLIHELASLLDSVLWRPVLFGGGVLLLIPLGRSWREKWLLLAAKGALLIFCIHPFIAPAHARHMPAFSPLLVLLVAFAACSRGGFSPLPRSRRIDDGGTFAAQGVIAVVVASVTVALL